MQVDASRMPERLIDSLDAGNFIPQYVLIQIGNRVSLDG